MGLCFPKELYPVASPYVVSSIVKTFPGGIRNVQPFKGVKKIDVKRISTKDSEPIPQVYGYGSKPCTPDDHP